MKVLKATEVAKKTSLSVPHIWRMAREDKFPKPFKLSDHRSGWWEDNVDAWISERIGEANA